MSSNIKFDTTIIEINGSYYMRIPHPVMKNLELTTESKINIIPETDNQGKKYFTTKKEKNSKTENKNQ